MWWWQQQHFFSPFKNASVSSLTGLTSRCWARRLRYFNLFSSVTSVSSPFSIRGTTWRKIFEMQWLHAYWSDQCGQNNHCNVHVQHYHQQNIIVILCGWKELTVGVPPLSSNSSSAKTRPRSVMSFSSMYWTLVVYRSGSSLLKYCSRVHNKWVLYAIIILLQCRTL